MTRFLPFLCAAAIATTVAAVPPVSLHIAHRVGTAPFTTRVRVTVDPHPANRYLCVAWSQVRGGLQHRSSCLTWDGETAPPTHWQDLKRLSAGKWEVVASVIRSDDRAYLSAPLTLTVIGPGYEGEPDMME